MAQQQGWIKLHRKLLDNPLWTSEPFTKAQAWVDLLLLASYKDGNYFYVRGIKVETNRGQLGYSMTSLCTRWRWSSGKVDRYLNRLQNENQITYQTSDVTTIITILNYDIFQYDDIPNENPNNIPNSTPNSRPNGNQTVDQTETNKKVKKDKKGKNSNDISNDISAKIEKEETAEFVKPTIEEVANYCAERNNGIDAEEFWNYYNATKWMRGTGKNKIQITCWRSCVATWERRNKKSSTQTQQPSIRSKRAAKALGRI